MKKIISIIFVSIIFILSSCSDFLTVEPTGTLMPDTYYNSEKDIEAALTGVYSTLKDRGLYGQNYSINLGNDADESYYFRSTYVYGPVIYNHTAYDNSVTNLWKTLYDGISRANLLLHQIKFSNNIDEEFLSRIKGETLFLRAYYYFILVQTFGDVPLILEPYLTPENLEVERTPIKDVYSQIVSDMETAEKMVLPIKEIGHGGRVSKSAVRGILARVYLRMTGEPLNDRSQLSNARKWASIVVNDYEAQHELNNSYEQVFINYAQDKYDIKESIWEVEFWGNLTDSYVLTGVIGGQNGIANNYDSNIGIARGFYAATKTLYDLYDENDLRRDWNIAPFKYSSTEDPANEGGYITEKIAVSNLWTRYEGKYRREYETLLPKAAHETPINYPLLRYSDVLLMLAEAENELHQMPTQTAYDAINKVRRRAFGKLLPDATDIDEYDFKDLTYDEFTKQLRDERSRELCFESLRKNDLIRWGIFVDRMHEVADIIESDRNTQTVHVPTRYCDRAFVNVTEKHLLQPIPAKEININKKLSQNDLWE